jgi:diaminohydroxyphosphoribosylaminopyrimidine deaminase/5-amino-6-(5-phosphoribosylamino)uracil reductase
MEDSYYMRRALRLAARARGRTSPNPMVGAVLVKGGRIIAEGYHRRAGSPHAEAVVLSEAGAAAMGATLFVTLEPCCHTGKKTPPCTRAIITGRIKRVVAAMQDPNPKVSGQGMAELRRAGIAVEADVLEAEARKLNEAYIKYITKDRPFVILKTAVTLDGKTATPTGESKWITCEKSRRLVHRVRSEVDALVTAIGTVQADDPELTARIRGGKNPLRVVIDPDLEISPRARLLGNPRGTVLVTRARNRKSERLEAAGVRMIRYDGRLHLDRLMRDLAGEGMMSVLIEGGASLNSHALKDGVVDRVMFFIAPKIIGGRDSYPSVGGSFYRSLKDAWRVRDMRARRVGEDILIEGRVSDPASGSPHDP